MPYQLKKSDKTLAAALRRIGRREIDHAIAAAGLPGDNAKGIHAARAHCKKIRALIRLVRPGFAAFDVENAAFREAAQSLETLRAGAAARETLDRLASAAPEGLDAAALDAIRAGLATEEPPRQLSTRRAADIAAFDDMMKRARARVAHWQVEGKGFGPARKGLKMTYAQARHRFEAARTHGTAEAFHDWRKAVKYHWYHTRLLRPIKPGRIDPRRALAKRLGEVLGAHHDLHDLRAHLAAGAVSPGAVAALQAPIHAETARLEDAALGMGARLFADDPGTLARRWQRWWKDW